MEADKEADRKYQELIMETEKMLLNVQHQLRLDDDSRQGSSTSITTSSFADSSSPSHNHSYNTKQYDQIFSQQALLPHGYRHTMTAPNKRVESIKNAELNVEMALAKSRNLHPELASGNIKDLQDHFSPKRLLHQVIIQIRIFDLIFQEFFLS